MFKCGCLCLCRKGFGLVKISFATSGEAISYSCSCGQWRPVNGGRSCRDNCGHQSEQATRPGWGQSSASAERQEARNRTRWSRDARRCNNCLQPGHIRASCPDAASAEQKQQALQAYAAWKRSHKNSGSKPQFHK